MKAKTYLLQASFLLIACRHDKAPMPMPQCSDSLGVITYQNTIKNIMNTHCVSCHNATSASAGIALDSYAGVKSAQENGGKLYSSVIWDGNAKKMPPGGNKLDDCTLARIKKWIDNGMPEN